MQCGAMKHQACHTRPDYDAALASVRKRYAHVVELPRVPFNPEDVETPWRDWMRDELDHPDLVITLSSAAGYLRDGPLDWPAALAVATNDEAVATFLALRFAFD